MTDENAALNNPAARLYAVLERARNIQASNISTGYAATFGVDVSNFGFVYRMLALMHVEADEVARLLAELGETDNYELYMESLPGIRHCILIEHFGVNWDEFKRRIKDVNLKTLRFCSNTLSRRHPENTVSTTRLKEIVEQIDHLYDNVVSSEITLELKVLILDQLEKIRRAIHEYRVRGVAGIRDAVADGALMALDRQAALEREASKYDRADDQQDYPDKLPRTNFVREYIALLADLITIVPWGIAQMHTLGPAIQHLLDSALK